MSVVVSCPSCAKQMRAPEAVLGKQVRCPSCQSTFTATAVGPPPPGAFRPGSGPAAPYPPRNWQEQRPAVDRAAAQAAVAGPAIALMIVSGLVVAFAVTLLLVLCGLGGAALGGAFGPMDQGKLSEEEMFIEVVVRLVWLMFVAVWDAVIFFSARQMKKMRSWGFALAGTIMALVPCSACCILKVPFGIWGIVVLCKPEVKEAFQ